MWKQSRKLCRYSGKLRDAFTGVAKSAPLLQIVQTGSGSYSGSYLSGSRGVRVHISKADNSLLVPNYTSTPPIRLRGVVHNYLSTRSSLHCAKSRVS
jgi:hypothetical protein